MGYPGGAAHWLSRVQVFGDMTFRVQNDIYDQANAVNEILDYNAINQAGGIAETTYPFLDTTDNRNRLRLRARFGVQANLTPEWTAVIRLSSGSLTFAPSESQNEGTFGERYTVGIDEALLRWDSKPPGEVAWMSVEGGRLLNPWFAPTELVWARDLTFEGGAATWRWAFGVGAAPIDRCSI